MKPAVQKKKDLKSLKEKYRDQFEMVSGLMNDWDPLSLLKLDAPKDEYDFEVARVLAAASKGLSDQELAAAVAQVIRDSFERELTNDACLQFAQNVNSKLQKAESPLLDCKDLVEFNSKPKRDTRREWVISLLIRILAVAMLLSLWEDISENGFVQAIQQSSLTRVAFELVGTVSGALIAVFFLIAPFRKMHLIFSTRFGFLAFLAPAILYSGDAIYFYITTPRAKLIHLIMGLVVLGLLPLLFSIHRTLRRDRMRIDAYFSK